MNRLSSEQTIVLGLVSATAIAALGFVIVLSLPDLTSQKWAAAIQASGSLVGIAIAIAIPAWQHQKSEQSKEGDRRIFAVAFSSQLRPHLTELKKGLEYIVSDLAREIAEQDVDERNVIWIDTGGDYSPHVRFIEDNWPAVAQLDGETARAVCKATAFYRKAIDENIDVENGVESYEDEDHSKWWEINFGSLNHAKGYLEGNRLALEQVEIALSQLDKALDA